MTKKDNSTLIAFSTMMILLMAVIIYFVITKKNSSDENSLLETEEEKIEELNYNLTFITPKKVFEAIRKENSLIIDTRNNPDFIENHIESSINIPLENFIEKEFQLDIEKNLIFIEKEGTQDGKKIANRLKENGYKLNYLKGGLYSYLGAGYDLISYGDVNSAQDRAKVNLIDLATLGSKLTSGERFIYLDVRKKSDFDKDHFENSVNIALEDLEKNKSNLPTGKLLIIDENNARSFKAAVRLSDMNVLTVYYLTDKYSEFKKAIQNKTLLK